MLDGDAQLGHNPRYSGSVRGLQCGDDDDALCDPDQAGAAKLSTGQEYLVYPFLLWTVLMLVCLNSLLYDGPSGPSRTMCNILFVKSNAMKWITTDVCGSIWRETTDYAKVHYYYNDLTLNQH